MLSREQLQRLDLPRQPRRGCVPTALAVGLTAIGYPHTPRRVIHGLKRFNAYADGIGVNLAQSHNLLEMLLKSGLTVHELGDDRAYWQSGYFLSTEPDAMERYREAVRKVRGEAGAAAIQADEFRAYAGQTQALLRPFVAAGRLVTTQVAELSGGVVAEHLAGKNAFALIDERGPNSKIGHTVAACNPQADPDVWVFSPSQLPYWLPHTFQPWNHRPGLNPSTYDNLASVAYPGTGLLIIGPKPRAV